MELPQKVGLLTFSSEDVGKIPSSECLLGNVAISSQLPGHILVLDIPDSDSASTHDEIKEYIREVVDTNCEVLEDSVWRSWAYTTMNPRWVCEVWYKSDDENSFAKYALGLWNHLTAADRVLMGILTMERIRCGEVLLDCRGVAALQNTKIHYACDFCLPVGPTKVVLLTRTTQEEWVQILTQHNATQYSAPRVYSIVDSHGNEWAAHE